jgi:hypothetical protein
LTASVSYLIDCLLARGVLHESCVSQENAPIDARRKFFLTEGSMYEGQIVVELPGPAVRLQKPTDQTPAVSLSTPNKRRSLPNDKRIGSEVESKTKDSFERCEATGSLLRDFAASRGLTLSASYARSRIIDRLLRENITFADYQKWLKEIRGNH